MATPDWERGLSGDVKYIALLVERAQGVSPLLKANRENFDLINCCAPLAGGEENRCSDRFRDFWRHTSCSLFCSPLWSLDPAHAQGLTFPTPTKTLCVNDPPATLAVPFTCTPTTPANSPSPGQAVFYAVTLGGPGAPAGTFTLLETLPPDFNLLGAKCIVDGTSTTTPLTTISVSSPPAPLPPVTTLGSVTLQAGQPVTCFIQGFFSNPGPTIQAGPR